MSEIAENIARVRAQIQEACKEAKRETSSVRLLAVSKTMPVEKLREAMQAGQYLFGENYVQEAAAKIALLTEAEREKCEFHLIGPLQRNKAKEAVKLFSLIHTVDRVSLAETLAKESEKIGKRQAILIQVNTSAEESKSGCKPEELANLLRTVLALPALTLRGLMCIGSYVSSDQALSERVSDFEQLRTLKNSVDSSLAQALPELSMGMSHDFDLAIHYGATIVRVGSSIFGSR